MKKGLFVFLFEVLFIITCHTQQPVSIFGYSVDLVQNRDVLLNSKLINPTSLTDSNRLIADAFLNKEWIGSEGIDKGFFISGESNLKSTKSSIGLSIEREIDQIGYSKNDIADYRTIILSYKYSFSKFGLGVNLGLLQSNFKISTSGFIDAPISIQRMVVYNPILNIGVSRKFDNQQLQFSITNPLSDKQDESYLSYSSRRMVLNYQKFYNFSSKVELVPEVYGCYDFGDVYAIVGVKINFDNKLEGGILYNTKKSFGILASGVLKKRIRIGYYIDYRRFSSEDFYGAHGINFKVIL